MRKIKGKEIDRFLDGGTQKILGDDGILYFIDHRIGTETAGKVFDRYPDHTEAKILNVEIELLN